MYRPACRVCFYKDPSQFPQIKEANKENHKTSNSHFDKTAKKEKSLPKVIAVSDFSEN